jgi:hypothetical protein
MIVKHTPLNTIRVELTLTCENILKTFLNFFKYVIPGTSIILVIYLLLLLLFIFFFSKRNFFKLIIYFGKLP